MKRLLTDDAKTVAAEEALTSASAAKAKIFSFMLMCCV
jgi:hypothetical protein